MMSKVKITDFSGRGDLGEKFHPGLLGLAQPAGWVGIQ
jgi:hypothetical protein